MGLLSMTPCFNLSVRIIYMSGQREELNGHPRQQTPLQMVPEITFVTLPAALFLFLVISDLYLNLLLENT